MSQQMQTRLDRVLRSVDEVTDLAKRCDELCQQAGESERPRSGVAYDAREMAHAATELVHAVNLYRARVDALREWLDR